MAGSNVIEFNRQADQVYDNLQELDPNHPNVLKCIDCDHAGFYLASLAQPHENKEDVGFVDVIICMNCKRAGFLDGDQDD